MTPFSASELQHLKVGREHISPPFEVPDCTQGWQEYLINTKELFEKLEPLRVKNGFQFRCFVTAMGGNSSSRLYAVPFQFSERPRGVSQKAAPTAEQILSHDSPHRPERIWNLAAGVEGEDPYREPNIEAALEHFMLGVEGDDTPLSYLLASFLTRDGEEFAAGWHGCRWRSETLLTETPFWPFERLDPLAQDVITALQESVLHGELESILIASNPEYRTLDGRLRDRVAQLCDIRPSFLGRLISEYSFGLEMARLDRFMAKQGRAPSEEEERVFKVEIPAEWEAALRLPTTPLAQWSWAEEPPAAWEPAYRVSETEVEIQFLTFTELGLERIVRHTDRYKRGIYLPQRSSMVLGKGKGGYIH